MFGFLGLLGCVALGGIWKAQSKTEINRVSREERRISEGTNYSRQLELFALYQATGKDEQGNPLTEPHRHPAEVQRIVKKQLEKEGIRWYNGNQWNMDNCVFDDEGHIISISGRMIDPVTGEYRY